MQKYEEYFKENCYEDTDHILTICETAGERIYDKFKLSFVNPETKKRDPQFVAACFAKIFEAILTKLESLEKEYPDFEINLLERLLIGYSTNNDEDDEKQGNFMIYCRHLNNGKKEDEIDDPTMSARERCVQWNAENIIVQPEIIKKVAIEACKMLEDIDVRLATSECIMPIFIFVYESCVNYLKIMRRERNEFEFEINFISCFFIGARESESGVDDIYIRPSINAKLSLKNDSIASAKYE